MTARIGADGRVERRLDRERPGAAPDRDPARRRRLERADRRERPRGLSLRRGPCRARAGAGAGAAAVRRALDRFAPRGFPGSRAGQCRAHPRARARVRARRRARRRADRGDDPFARASISTIVAAALKSERFGYVGLIGSATKRARFLRQMRDAGLTEAMLARLVCPIGVAGIEGKDPAVIAASTAAQLLMMSERLAETRGRGRPAFKTGRRGACSGISTVLAAAARRLGGKRMDFRDLRDSKRNKSSHSINNGDSSDRSTGP